MKIDDEVFNKVSLLGELSVHVRFIRARRTNKIVHF